LAAIEENFLREWKNYQSEFKHILQSKAKDEGDALCHGILDIYVNRHMAQ